MSTKHVYITGRGVINPAGNSIKDFWENLLTGKTFYNKLDIKDNTPIKVGALVQNFDFNKYFSKRIAIKTDTFTHYFLAAVNNALDESNMIISDKNEYSVGIFYGNNSGGWSVCERGFNELFNQSYDMVNPWQATAWFPTAGQGYASILHGIKGYSKTFVADRVSSAAALYHGILSLLNERNKKIIVGGSEAPLTALGTICYNENGGICKEISEVACRPFVQDSQGVILSEGGTAVVLETSDNLDSLPIAEIKGFATNYYKTNQIAGVVDCINKAIKMADLDVSDIDLIIPEGNGDWTSDYIEKSAITKIFSERMNELPIMFPKYYFGHQYGAAAISDIICACMSLEYNEIPHYRFIDDLDELFTDNIRTQINNVLVNSRTNNGVNYSFVISRSL